VESFLSSPIGSPTGSEAPSSTFPSLECFLGCPVGSPVRSFESVAQAPRVSYGSPSGSVAPCRESSESGPDERTTLMFRNLPEGMARCELEDLLDAEGFATRYDFLYMPANLGTKACFGYAFINMVTPGDARAFIEHFQGFQAWQAASEKRAAVHMSEELQGLEAMIERYRNSPLMHSSVSDVLRPVIYCGGRRAPFPGPTVPLKPPRARRPNRREGATQ